MPARLNLRSAWGTSSTPLQFSSPLTTTGSEGKPILARGAGLVALGMFLFLCTMLWVGMVRYGGMG